MVYKTEYSTRRVFSSDPRPTVTSYSYSYNPISRRRAKPVITSTRVIRSPYPTPLGDQELLSLLTLGGGRAGSVPIIAVQRLSATPPPRSSTRLHNLYQELEDDLAGNSQGLGAIVPSYRRSVTPIRCVTPVRAMSPSRAYSPGPIRSITYHAQPEEQSREYSPSRDYQLQPLARSRADDYFLHLAYGLQPPLYSLHHIPLRSAMDLKEACDVRRQYVHERNMYDPISRLQSDIYRMAFNRAPRRVPGGYVAGNGTLACLTYAGTKPIPKRRRFYPDEELATDYKFNNYYKPSAVGSYYSTSGKKPVYQPIYRSKKSLLGLPDTPKAYRKETASYWEQRSSDKKSPSPAPVRAPPRRIVASSPPPAPRPVIPQPEPESNDSVSFVLRKPKKSVSQEPETPVEEVPPPSPPAPTQNLSPDVAVAFKLPRRSVSQEPAPEPEVEPEPVAVEEPEPVQVQVTMRRPSPKPAAPEPKEPTPPPAEPEPVAEPEIPEPAEEAPVEVEEEAAPAPEPEPEAEPAETTDVLVEETIVEAEAAPAEPEASPEEVAVEAPAAESEAKGEEIVGEESNEPNVEEEAAVEETSVAEVSAADSAQAEEAAPAPEETSAPAEDISAPVEETTPQAEEAAPASEEAATISEDVAPPAEDAPVADAPADDTAEPSLEVQEEDLSEDKNLSNPVCPDEPLDEPEELPFDEPEESEVKLNLSRQDLSDEEEELESED